MPAGDESTRRSPSFLILCVFVKTLNPFNGLEDAGTVFGFSSVSGAQR